MDRKNRVWLIVLAVLLLAAIAGMVVIRNQLSASEAEYASVSSRLTSEQESAAALKEELDAVQAQAALLQQELDASAAESAQRADALETSADELNAARETISALEAQVNALSASATILPTAQPTAQPTPASVSNIILTAALESAKTANAELKTALENDTIDMKQVSLCAESMKAAISALESQVAAFGSDELAQAVESARLAGEPVAELASKALTDEEKLLRIVSGEIDSSVETLTDALTSVGAILSGDVQPSSASGEPTAEPSEEPTAAPTPSAEEPAQSGALSDLEQQLSNAKTAVSDLENQLSDGSTQISELESQLNTLRTQTETDASDISALEAQLAEAKDEAEALKRALEDARAEYERRLAELEAYRLSRTLTDGDAHASTAASSLISVAADGVTGAWNYANQTISGNAVVLSLVLDGEEIYRSDALQPGDTIETIALSRALSAGEYEATAVAAIYDADGNCLFASRTPVALTVAAE